MRKNSSSFLITSFSAIFFSISNNVDAPPQGINYDSWQFIYCQTNTTHVCQYNNGIKSCNARTDLDGGFFAGSEPFIIGQKFSGNTNYSLDDFQIRNVALNDANISQLYYDGLHRLRPDDFASNNSVCHWYIQNATGTILAKTQTLGFNVTSCTLNSIDTTQFKSGNNISANFTPVNNFEVGLPSQNTTKILIINESVINFSQSGIFTFRTQFDVAQGQALSLCKNVLIPNCTVRLCYPT